MKTIDSFRGKYFWLSNYFLSPVEFEKKWYPSVEHAYQAAKTIDKNIRKKIQRMTANEARLFGQTIPLIDNWNFIRIPIMFSLCKQKFMKHKDLQIKLKETENAELIEGNDYNDIFWGICNGIGENHLGKVLMQVRDDFALYYWDQPKKIDIVARCLSCNKNLPYEGLLHCPNCDEKSNIDEYCLTNA